MRDAIRRLPVPVTITPEVAGLISAVVQEFKKLAIRDHVLVDRKRRHIDGMAVEFIVPAKFS